MPYPNEHAARIRNPGVFDHIVQLWAKGGIRVLGGPLKSNPSGPSKPQAYRFKSSRFTVEEAKNWLKNHNVKYILFEPATGVEKDFAHNSTVADSEPFWGSINKVKLPRDAFADHGEADKKSTWDFPHHWVKGSSEVDEDGIYADGTMYLHKGGLNAAWIMAYGARSGEESSDAMKAHLSIHRKALDLDERKTAEMRMFKADEEKHLVYCVVLEPNFVDAQDEFVSVVDIEEAAHNYMRRLQNQKGSRVKLSHEHEIDDVVDVVESYMAPVDFKIEDHEIKKGSWIAVMKIWDDSLWDATKNEIKGFSIGGYKQYV